MFFSVASRALPQLTARTGRDAAERPITHAGRRPIVNTIATMMKLSRKPIVYAWAWMTRPRKCIAAGAWISAGNPAWA